MSRLPVTHFVEAYGFHRKASRCTYRSSSTLNTDSPFVFEPSLIKFDGSILVGERGRDDLSDSSPGAPALAKAAPAPMLPIPADVAAVRLRLAVGTATPLLLLLMLIPCGRCSLCCMGVAWKLAGPAWLSELPCAIVEAGVENEAPEGTGTFTVVGMRHGVAAAQPEAVSAAPAAVLTPRRRTRTTKLFTVAAGSGLPATGTAEVVVVVVVGVVVLAAIAMGGVGDPAILAAVVAAATEVCGTGPG